MADSKDNMTPMKGKSFTERLVRLACIKRAASVRPEPGSNSPYEFIFRTSPFFHYLVIKVLPRPWNTITEMFSMSSWGVVSVLRPL